MEERREIEYAYEEIDLDEYIAIFRKIWWKVIALSLAAGIVTLAVLFRMPNLYEATAVVTPAAQEGRQPPAFGALALLGMEVGGPSTVEELDTLFKSNDLTVRVIKKNNLWPIVLGDRFDPATGKMKRHWTDRFLGGKNEPRPPGEWDGIHAAKERLKISMNKKAGTVSVSFESSSPEASASIVNHYLEEGKSRLQEEAFERAVKNKKFIEEQIGRTVDALTRDRLYALYGQEVEREMLARNREQFGFKVIDSARAPDRKSSPQRAKIAAFVTILSMLAATVVLTVKGKRDLSSKTD